MNLIRHTTTKTGLTVQAALEMGNYETGIAVKDKAMAPRNIERPGGQNQQANDTIRPGVLTAELLPPRSLLMYRRVASGYRAWPSSSYPP